MSLITISPKYQKLLSKYDAPKFLIGFEFEGYVKQHTEKGYEDHYGYRDNGDPIKNSKYYEFYAELKKIHPKVDIDEDGSIEPPEDGQTYIWEPVEFKTAALPLKQGIELLDQLLTFLEKWKRAKIWGTNETCGFHINLSEQKIFKSEDESSKFYCRILQKFHQKRILRMFGRLDNDYCEPLHITKADREDFGKMYDKFGENGDDCDSHKYLAVANRFGERIEFRCLGNKNYELKKDKINQTIAHIYDCALKSYVECMEAKKMEYANSEDDSDDSYQGGTN